MRGVVPRAEWREDCAPRRGLKLFGTTWTSMILHTLHALHGGVAPTGVLQRASLSKKMLVQRLCDMESSGLIDRHVVSSIPPQVEDRLTPLGVRFVEPVQQLYDSGRQNADALDALTARVGSRRVQSEESDGPQVPRSDIPAMHES